MVPHIESLTAADGSHVHTLDAAAVAVVVAHGQRITVEIPPTFTTAERTALVDQAIADAAPAPAPTAPTKKD